MHVKCLCVLGSLCLNAINYGRPVRQHTQHICASTVHMLQLFYYVVCRYSIHNLECWLCSYVAAESWVEMLQRAERDGRSLVEQYQKKLHDHQVRGSVHFEVGAAGPSVVNAANENRASMIVMGTRGFGVIRRTILGSVSEYVIHHTKVPVTVVPRETQSWFF